MKKNIYLTEKGLTKIKNEVVKLKKQIPEILQRLRDTRYIANLITNTEFASAKEELTKMEKKIKELENLIKNAVIITSINTKEVSLGTKVKLKFLADNTIETYTIVSTYEVDPFDNCISNEAPIGKAILGKKVNDTVTVINKTGDYKVKVLKVFA